MNYTTSLGVKDILSGDLIVMLEEYQPEPAKYFVVFDVSKTAIGVHLSDGSQAYIDASIVIGVYRAV